MLLLSNFIFKLWVGNNVIIPFSISTIMMFNIIAQTRSSMFITVIGGIGKIKIILFTNIILSLLYIPMSVFLGKMFRIEGIIFANLMVNTVYAIIAPIQLRKILNGTARGTWNE
jgi:hypothetical protein